MLHLCLQAATVQKQGQVGKFWNVSRGPLFDIEYFKNCILLSSYPEELLHEQCLQYVTKSH